MIKSFNLSRRCKKYELSIHTKNSLKVHEAKENVEWKDKMKISKHIWKHQNVQ